MMTDKQANTVSRKPAAQSYLLNIYPPHAHGNSTALVGTVEKLGNEGKHSFHDVQELLHLLGIDNFKSRGWDNEQTN